MERIRYNNEELANMLLIYGQCHKNQRQAAALYAARFPDKRHPGHGFFTSLFSRVCRYGLFHAPTRPRVVPQRDEETINNVREALIANPHTSTRSIAHDLQLCHVKVHKIIKHNLGWHPFKRHKTQKLFPQNLPRREAFCDWLSEQVDLNNIANDYFLRRILWTDECTFRSDGHINRHNEHHYAEENPHCRKETHIQGQFHINVWMGILDNQVIGPYFFPENIKITAQVYSAFLEEILPDLLEDVPLAIRPNIIFQQDGHPAHTSFLARTVLNQRFRNR
ncbi:PREDICTED: uncharacterized protein LOC105556413 [Vollenhovia emeryi]|uniref:uncharacterized protein LOC105556413 n=1 Tax=Vollenhovia emeryi TaxID=411798 RepID=UPI0005F51C48|nr:PREDICTED: uncharacterized protein LOC105556413 [Vollenhovia emeryi]